MPGSPHCREVFGACNKIKVFLSFDLGVKVMGLTNIFAFHGLSRQTGHAVEEFLWRFPQPVPEIGRDMPRLFASYSPRRYCTVAEL